ERLQDGCGHPFEKVILEPHPTDIQRQSDGRDLGQMLLKSLPQDRGAHRFSFGTPTTRTAAHDSSVSDSDIEGRITSTNDPTGLLVYDCASINVLRNRSSAAVNNAPPMPPTQANSVHTTSRPAPRNRMAGANFTK